MFKLAPDPVAETAAASTMSHSSPLEAGVAAMSASAPEPVRAGDLLVVEAGSPEQALQEVAAKLGDRAEIVAAEKVRKGGVAGFFSREVCRLTVRVPGGPAAPRGAAPAPAAAEAPAQPAEPLGLDDMLTRMAAQAQAEEAGFAELLRARMSEGAEPAEQADAAVLRATQAARAAQVSLLNTTVAVRPETGAPEHLGVAPLPRVAAPESGAVTAPYLAWTRDPSAAPGTGPVRWSAGMLERLGLPPALIAATEAQQPVDDAGWLVALAAAVAPYCRPLPNGAAVLAGPKAGVLGHALRLPVTKRPDEPDTEGAVCLQLRDTLPAREWLAGARAGRWLHLVVGGTGWHGLLFDEPLAVSWVGADALPAALHQCAAFGLVLGYGVDAPGGALLRANPVDVALSVRSLLPRR